MAQTGLRMTVAMAILVVLCVRSSAQQSTCTPAIVSLAPCLGFVTGNTSIPSSPCCTQLASVVQTQAKCVCTFLNSGAARLGLKFNQTQALTLPGACKIQTPPLSQCNAVVGPPAASPTEAPAPVSAPIPSSPSDIAPITSSTPTDQSPGTPSVPSVPTGSSSPTSSSTPATVTPSGRNDTDSGAKTVPSASSQSSAVGSSTPSLVIFLLLAGSALSSF